MDKRQQIKEIAENECAHTPTERELDIMELNCFTINDVADYIWQFESVKV